MYVQLVETLFYIVAAIFVQGRPLHLRSSISLMMADALEGLAKAWERDVPRLLGAMRAAGMWRSAALAKFFRTSPPETGDVEALVNELLPDAHEEEIDYCVPYIREAVGAAQQDRRRHSYSRAVMPVWEVAAEDLKRKLARDAEEYEKLFERQRMGKALRTVPPRPATGRTGTQARAARELDGDPNAREKGEAKTRDRWITLMGDFLKEDGVEGVHHKLLAAGRRAATLRTRMLAWKPFRAWLRGSRGTTRPRGPEDYIDYMLLRSDEPCSRGTLDGVLALFSFVEGLYGRGKGTRWTDTPYFQSAAREIRSGLTLRLDGAEVKKALRPTWLMLAGLEQHVMNADVGTYDRVLAWYASVSSWCVFRFDDHRGWMTGALKADALGWTWDLVRTKTTGRGKAAELRPVALSSEAYVRHKDWFVTGHALLMEMSPGERDYLLTIPPGSGDTQAVPRELGYEEYVCRMRAMLSTVELGDGQVGKALSELYSAHSWRFFLPSAAGAVGYPPEHVNTIGTWSVKGGEGYNKLAKERSRQVQSKVAAAGRMGHDSKDVFSDHLDQPETIKRLIERGLDEDSSLIVARRLVKKLGEENDNSVSRDPAGHEDECAPGYVGAASSSSGTQTLGVSSKVAEPRLAGRLP